MIDWKKIKPAKIMLTFKLRHFVANCIFAIGQLFKNSVNFFVLRHCATKIWNMLNQKKKNCN